MSLIGLLLLVVVPTSFAQEFDWELARPSGPTRINHRVEGSNSDGAATVGLGVNITYYYENDPQILGCDGLGLMISATANTREIISYAVSPASYTWYTVNNPISIPGDNDGQWIPFTYPVRFYGSRRSAEYNGVYVCRNGFITFDSSPHDPYYGRTIPSQLGPNTFIAPFWSDLLPNPASSITYGYVEAVPGYVISWNNVPNKYGTPQTFQVVIELAPGAPHIYRNSRIWFNYQSITLDDDITVGIEDQRGLKGVSNNFNIGNGMALRFWQASNQAFIQYLTIKANRGGDQYALIDLDESGDWVRGENVEITSDQPDSSLRWLFALAGAGALCLEHLSPWGWVQDAGVIIGATLVGVDIAEVLADTLSPVDPDYMECDDDLPDPISESHIKVAAIDRSIDDFTCVDAALGIRAWWLFTDPNNQDHDITITAELTYAVFDSTGTPIAYETIPASVDLSVFIPKYLTISNNDVDNGYTTPQVGTWACRYGSTVTVYAHAYVDCVVDHWTLDGSYAGNDSQYTVTMNSNHNLRVYFRRVAGPGGGCPYVSTWNGTQWLLDNNLIPSAEYTNGTDITDFYRLQQSLALEDGKYSLKIWDLDKHSFLDQVKLLAVDHESDVNIAVSPYGEILTYKNPAPLVTAIDQDNQDVSSILNTVDGNYYEGNAGDSILIDFGNLDVSKGAKLVLRTDYCPLPPCKSPYSIHILNASGSWIDVASIIPRMYWSTDIVDLSDYLPDGNGEVKLKLYFTATHKIDYVGMDTTEQGEFEVSYGNLVKAKHCRLGEVKELLRDSDNLRVELLPGDYVTLQFTAPQLEEEKRDFMIVLEGHYFIIS